MKRPALVVTGALVGLAGVLGYHALSPSLPTFVVVPNQSSGTSTTAPTTTTSAPPPPHATTTLPGPTPTTAAPSTTTTVAPSTTTTGVTPRSATGESVNYIYGVLSVKVTASGSTISNVSIGSINDGGNFRSESIDQASIPQLEQQALAAQSANIQGVSGASYTSAGFRQSLQSALSKLGL